MNRKQAVWLVVAIFFVAVSGFAVAQGKYKKRARSGPFRVVVSKPLNPINPKSGKLYRESEYLSAMFNELDKDGLVPVSTSLQTIIPPQDGLASWGQMVVVCRTKE